MIICSKSVNVIVNVNVNVYPSESFIIFFSIFNINLNHIHTLKYPFMESLNWLIDWLIDRLILFFYFKKKFIIVIIIIINNNNCSILVICNILNILYIHTYIYIYIYIFGQAYKQIEIVHVNFISHIKRYNRNVRTNGASCHRLR